MADVAIVEKGTLYPQRLFTYSCVVLLGFSAPLTMHEQVPGYFQTPIMGQDQRREILVPTDVMKGHITEVSGYSPGSLQLWTPEGSTGDGYYPNLKIGWQADIK